MHNHLLYDDERGPISGPQDFILQMMGKMPTVQGNQATAMVVPTRTSVSGIGDK
jgi:hypothetical protein